MYATLAGVYEFLTPDPLITPEGSADAFAGLLEPGARVLGCACGIGLRAAGLAARGFAVDASDASPEMVARARALGVGARVCRWDLWRWATGWWSATAAERYGVVARRM